METGWVFAIGMCVIAGMCVMNGALALRAKHAVERLVEGRVTWQADVELRLHELEQARDQQS